jgi:predicted component of viral defense system (DUF524 family)
MLLNMFTASDRYAPLKSGHSLRDTHLGRTITHKTGRNLYPTEAIEERKHLTVDTNENRFVKHFLQAVQRRLNGLQNALNPGKKGYLNPDIEQNLETMTKKIGGLLADPLWYDVGTMSFIPFSSQVLQRREGYRQLFQLYSLLQLASVCDFFNRNDFRNLLETKDTPTLFEYWSFFVIKKILDGMLKIRSCGSVVSDNSLEQNVEDGLSIRYEDGITLFFNKTYQGTKGCQPGDSLAGTKESSESYSHDLRPDIVIEHNNRLLIFDAKFKGERGGFYGDSGDETVISCKNEDIDKMHCYREAIQGVIGAYILFPGENAAIYSAHNATSIYQGVGALPLKPEEGARPVHKHRDDIERIIREFVL